MSNRLIGLALLAGLCAAITIVQSQYVGDLTIYALELQEGRSEAHQAIYENEKPEGGWQYRGMNGLNVRVVPVYLAEHTARLLGLKVVSVYKLLDMSFIFATLMGVFLFLKRWFAIEYCILAVLYLGAILPMTYAHHFFHPWDRMAWFAWLLILWAIAEDRFFALCALLVVTVGIKYDCILLPAVYFLTWVTRDNWRGVTAKTVLLFLLTFGTFATLRVLLPGGFEEKDVFVRITSNIYAFLNLHVSHPPLLGFALPVLLALLGTKSANRFALASAAFGLALFVPLFVAATFIEIRAQMGIMLLILPAALFGLRHLVELSGSTVRQESR